LVVVISLFEQRAAGLYHNTAIVLEKDGQVAGKYRKMHIPDDPGYYEKFYFTPGDLGFHPIQTSVGKLGVLICWDQWFPESARIMALKGAEILFYPSAIGSDCHDHWETVMRGHAAANIMPLVCSNRIGREAGSLGEVTYFGQAFIAGPKGQILERADDASNSYVLHGFDLDEIREMRAHWGLFRDRRPDLYGPLLTMDGETRLPQ